MGWNGGTEIFDKVACELTDLSRRWTGTYRHEDFMEPLTTINKLLESMDWDNQCESEYWDDSVIGKILGNKYLDYVFPDED